MKTRVLLMLTLSVLVGILVLLPRPVEEAQDRFGWISRPDQVEALKSRLPFPHFRETEAYQAACSAPEDVYLWESCRQATGELLPPRDQGSVGACVAFATASAVEHLLCVQIANGANEVYRDLVQEIIYGGSRVEIGGGQIRGDGSIGAWAAKFVQDYGVLPRGIHGPFDLRHYDLSRCRVFGRDGVPTQLKPLVQQHPVRTISNVRSWEECRAAIRNGYPVIVCSSQGFSLQRDADGFCLPRGVWMHAMAILGVQGGRRPGGFLLNSWGATAHSGPLGAGQPSPAGFWADARVLDRMLKQGDSWAFSSAVGFPGQKLNWYARVPFSSLRGENENSHEYDPVRPDARTSFQSCRSEQGATAAGPGGVGPGLCGPAFAGLCGGLPAGSPGTKAAAGLGEAAVARSARVSVGALRGIPGNRWKSRGAGPAP